MKTYDRILIAITVVLLLAGAYLKGHTDAIQENVTEMQQLRDGAIALGALADAAGCTARPQVADDTIDWADSLVTELRRQDSLRRAR